MTTTQMRRLRKLIADIRQCADEADFLALTLGNGAEAGSLLGSIADDLELQHPEASNAAR
jgi:hypothetical protein